MNRIIMMGRLCNVPEVRYGGANNTAVANFRIAVNRRFPKEGEMDADFFRVVAFGKLAEFCEKYLRKGIRIVMEGELRNNNYTDKAGKMVYQDQIMATSIEFAESKKSQEMNGNAGEQIPVDSDGFMNIPAGIDEELPFK